MKILITLISLAAALLAASTHYARAQGTVIFQHSGATDPVNEGFSASIAPFASVGPVMGDLGLNAWFTEGGGPATVFYTKQLSAEELAQLAGADWTISVTLRVVRSPETYANSFVSFATGSEIFLLGFGSESDGDPFVRTYDSNVAYVLDGGGSAYYNFQLMYHSLTGTADLWVNGIQRLNNVASRPSQQAVFTWGEGQFPTLARANWNLVSLEAIPEPSSLALLGCGAVLLAGYWLRRFRKRK